MTETGCGVGAGAAALVVTGLVALVGEVRMLVIVVGVVATAVGEGATLAVGVAPLVVVVEVRLARDAVVVGVALSRMATS